VDDEPTFSYPLTLTTNAITFGTKAQAGWGNALANVYYRVRALSADNVRSLPSPTLTVHITNAAAVPAAVSQVAPAAGASVSTPFLFDWSDTPNPQVPGYDLQVDTTPNFTNNVLLLPGVARSDFMITPDLLAPGNYFWRVRALHGDVAGPLVRWARDHGDSGAAYAGGLRLVRDHNRARQRLRWELHDGKGNAQSARAYGRGARHIGE
jgi:hypothetical protein